MKTRLVLIAGAFLSLAAFSQSGDPSAEERFRMKTGRYTPAEEARRNALRAREAQSPAVPSCCSYMKSSFNNESATSASNEERYRVKYGRNTPAAEARQKAVAQEQALHVNRCVELGKCTLMPGEAAPQAMSTSVTADDHGRSARDKAKMGREFPLSEVNSPPLVASAVLCEHECCKKAL